MTTDRLRKALNQLHQVIHPTGGDALTDSQLLARFLASRDEAAFAALVRRHSPMVLGVCRRILHHAQDAEDAFQAAFLVLARKASSLANRQALGSWLYRVSWRIALESRAINDKRRARERQVEECRTPPSISTILRTGALCSITN
jgi:DNA-directed RNA polymerase specialized sigma24 family protein